MPDSAGIPHVIEGEVLIAPYNDLPTVEALLAVHADSLAAVIVEPFQRIIPPRDGFLEGVRRLTQRYGIPLIFDEVVTGFRFAYGGAQEALWRHAGSRHVRQDRRRWLSARRGRGARGHHVRLRPAWLKARARSSRRSGTLNGNPIAAAAGLASLAELRKPGVYERVRAIGGALMTGLADLTKKLGITAQVVGPPDGLRRVLHRHADRRLPRDADERRPRSSSASTKHACAGAC